MFGTRPYNNTREDVDYRYCDGEEHMLQSFLAFWQENYPDILTGWNVELYDVPYICGRLKNVFNGQQMKLLSPWSMVHGDEIEIKGRKNIVYDLKGINVMDYMDLYKKFTYTNQESYRLDHIANVELSFVLVLHLQYDLNDMIPD